MENITPTQTLDCRELSCPMPTLETKKAIAGLASGEILEVLGTDPGTKNDIKKFVEKSGHQFLGFSDEDGHTRYLIKKG